MNKTALNPCTRCNGSGTEPQRERVWAQQLHDLRFDIKETAAYRDDAIGGWLFDVARRLEDIEDALVSHG